MCYSCPRTQIMSLLMLSMQPDSSGSMLLLEGRQTSAPPNMEEKKLDSKPHQKLKEEGSTVSYNTRCSPAETSFLGRQLPIFCDTGHKHSTKVQSDAPLLPALVRLYALDYRLEICTCWENPYPISCKANWISRHLLFKLLERTWLEGLV